MKVKWINGREELLDMSSLADDERYFMRVEEVPYPIRLKTSWGEEQRYTLTALGMWEAFERHFPEHSSEVHIGRWA